MNPREYLIPCMGLISPVTVKSKIFIQNLWQQQLRILVIAHPYRFVMAKTRVAPLKQLSLPKLKLMGALTGARLCSFITNTIKLCPSMIHLWMDSQIVLYRLLSEKKLNQFVSHSVRSTTSLLPPHGSIVQRQTILQIY